VLSAADSVGSVAPALPNYQNPNVEWHNKVAMAIDKIKEQFGMDIERADPLPEEEGFTAPCNENVLKDRLRDATK
jgi:hypothetical protein